MAYQKKSVYEIVTERVIRQISEGTIPWEKPWVSIGGNRVGGYAHRTGNSYSLINQMMLPEPGEYITPRQVQEEGGSIRPGAVGYPIVFWKNFKTTVRNPDTNLDEEKEIPCLRYYTVYNIKDCDGITANFAPDESALDGLKEPQRCKAADLVVSRYLKESGVKLAHKAQDRAFYAPYDDTVTLPLKKQFKKKAEYYSTLFHELTHSTGHRERLNRFGADTSFARGNAYSLEELVAEIGACAALDHLHLDTKSSQRNSTAYLSGWLRALHNDPKMIVSAAGRAQKAVRYIFEGPDGITPTGDWKPVKNTKIDDGSHGTLPWT